MKKIHFSKGSDREGGHHVSWAWAVHDGDIALWLLGFRLNGPCSTQQQA